MAFPAPPFAGESDDSIRTRMLDAVADTFIKVEGDPIYDMLQPAALELERAYAEMETMVAEVFPATATGEYLDALALQYTGLERNTDETDADFRARVLDAMGAPAGAGTQRDYRAWLSGVAGIGPVTAVSTDPNEVTVYVLDEGHEAADAPLLADALSALNAVKPVSVTVLTAAPTLLLDGPFVLTLPGSSSSQRTEWTTLVTEYLDSIHPGTDFNIYALLGAAGIPESYYDSHDFDGNTTASVPAVGSESFHATTVTLGG